MDDFVVTFEEPKQPVYERLVFRCDTPKALFDHVQPRAEVIQSKANQFSPSDRMPPTQNTPASSTTSVPTPPSSHFYYYVTPPTPNEQAPPLPSKRSPPTIHS